MTGQCHDEDIVKDKCDDKDLVKDKYDDEGSVKDNELIQKDQDDCSPSANFSASCYLNMFERMLTHDICILYYRSPNTQYLPLFKSSSKNKMSHYYCNFIMP